MSSIPLTIWWGRPRPWRRRVRVDWTDAASLSMIEHVAKPSSQLLTRPPPHTHTPHTPTAAARRQAHRLTTAAAPRASHQARQRPNARATSPRGRPGERSRHAAPGRLQGAHGPPLGAPPPAPADARAELLQQHGPRRRRDVSEAVVVVVVDGCVCVCVAKGRPVPPCVLLRVVRDGMEAYMTTYSTTNVSPSPQPNHQSSRSRLTHSHTRTYMHPHAHAHAHAHACAHNAGARLTSRRRARSPSPLAPPPGGCVVLGGGGVVCVCMWLRTCVRVKASPPLVCDDGVDPDL
jgi:hypothetical protein